MIRGIKEHVFCGYDTDTIADTIAVCIAGVLIAVVYSRVCSK